MKAKPLQGRRSLLLGVLAGFGNLTACGVVPLPTLTPPTLSVSGLEPVDASREQLRFNVRVTATNPNSSALPIRALGFAVEVGGVEIAQAVAAEAPFELPARGSREITLAFTSPTGRLLEAARRLPLSKIDYRLHGTATWGPLAIRIPFERKGELDPLRLLMRRPAGTPAPGG